MPRICYVIMPFSDTKSCNEEEWTHIFRNVFKPAIEGAGLDYECRRSSATRGNIVAMILQDLDDGYVVLADLTDQNPNVFYELGVRHTLKDRTILVAQKSEDIPFDLRGYAYHIYDWKTTEGLSCLANTLHELLADIDNNPDRPDNPVSDFLRTYSKTLSPPPVVPISPDEVIAAQPLAGEASEGLDAAEFARRLARKGRPQDTNIVFQLTQAVLQPMMKKIVEDLNRSEAGGQIQRDQIPMEAQKYISKLESLIEKVEQFVLASVEQNWGPGVELALRMAGNWISISEGAPSGHIIRFAQGAPSLLAWRMLILMGAKAIAGDAFNLLAMILRNPIEVEDASGRFSNRPLIQRRDLFFAEAFLGYVDHSVNYVKALWQNQDHLHEFFTSEEDFHFHTAKFLIVASLASSLDRSSRPLYPSYQLLPQARRAMSSICNRMAASEPYLNGIAEALGESGDNLRQTWSKRVELLNKAISESQRWPFRKVVFPDPMDADVAQW